MQFTFLKGNTVAFMRNDAEQAAWVQEEMSVNATFPFLPDKVIERGMLILFEDLGEWHAFEIRSASVVMGDSYQQITAESIAISELTDCHIANDIELTNLTAKQALQKAIAGTGWSIGNDTSSGTSSADFQRGSAWQAVNTVKSNWNVYITPRVTVCDTGITGRFLDISPYGGVWRGLRLSIDKNLSDASVTYDDSELYTALYGYGGSETVNGETVETTFSDQVWQKTKDHPAKPKGQKYLEYPEMTALYGRSGKARFGFYQNPDIKDPATLLNKTWQALKACCEPKISITGTATDLKRYGYNDEPLRLHDLAVIEIRPAGIMLQREIIQLTIDLLNPTGNTPTIGSYIPNIIYINRETYDYASDEGGGASGGRGGGGSTRAKKKQGQFETDISANERTIRLTAKQVDENRKTLRAAGIEVDPITGVLIYHDDVENGIGSRFQVQSNAITAEVKARTAEDKQLRSEIKVQKDKISLVVTESGGGYVVNSASIVAGINSGHGSYIKLRADTIDLSGYVTASQLKATDAKIENLVSGHTTAAQLNAVRSNITNLTTYVMSFDGHGAYWQGVTINGIKYHFMGYVG